MSSPFLTKKYTGEKNAYMSSELCDWHFNGQRHGLHKFIHVIPSVNPSSSIQNCTRQQFVFFVDFFFSEKIRQFT